MLTRTALKTLNGQTSPGANLQFYGPSLKTIHQNFPSAILYIMHVSSFPIWHYTESLHKEQIKSDNGGAWMTVGLADLEGLFQPDDFVKLT